MVADPYDDQEPIWAWQPPYADSVKPLQPISLGLLVVAVTASLHGFDLLPNPLGWLLVMLGVRDLPADLDRRSTTVTMGWAATVVSVPLWVPAFGDAVAHADPGLGWATDLPGIAFTALLCRGLALRAAVHGARSAAALLRVMVTANLVVGLLPILVFGAGVGGAAVPADTAFVLTRLAMVALCFGYADRDWALGAAVDCPVPKAPTGPSPGA